ncbi:MAG: hypothetical protein QOE01_2031 [Actinomycetota bacterium]|nr:hypothetical protein [Actinomycetota bacterium]
MTPTAYRDLGRGHHGHADHGFGGWLVALALGYAVFQHAGELFRFLGDVGDTRWADWVDLLTPYVVTGTAAGALRAAGATRTAWGVFWFATVLYTQGQGIHLAANSIGNVAPGQPAHLWDEVVGHYLWYAGFALVMVTLAGTLADRAPRGGIGAHLLALLVGFTNFTNWVEGGTAVAGIVVATGFLGWGLLTRYSLGRLLITCYGFSLVLLAVFGVWQGGFPQFSELGWI